MKVNSQCFRHITNAPILIKRRYQGLIFKAWLNILKLRAKICGKQLLSCEVDINQIPTKALIDLRNDQVRLIESLRNNLLNSFEGLLSNTDLRIAIQAPPNIRSPAGGSITQNLHDTLNFLGVPCRKFYFGESIEGFCNSFEPNVLLTSHNEVYLQEIDFDYINTIYKRRKRLIVGATATTSVDGNNTPMDDLLRMECREIDFMYAYRSAYEVNENGLYDVFKRAGYNIFPLEFGFNACSYKPLINNGKENFLDYIFFGSDNLLKYRKYFYKILKNFSGYAAGPDWGTQSWTPIEMQNRLYSRSLVGLNLHQNFQIKHPVELNERFYTLSGLGIPQVMDKPAILKSYFPKSDILTALNEEEYYDNFVKLRMNYSDSLSKAYDVAREVYGQHTYFHRAIPFCNLLNSFLNR